MSGGGGAIQGAGLEPGAIPGGEQRLESSGPFRLLTLSHHCNSALFLPRPHCKCHGNCGSQGHSNGPGESLAPEHFLYGSPNSKTVPARHGFESSAKAQAQDPSSLWPHGPPCPPHQKEVGGGRPPHRPPGDAESPHVQAARGLGAVPRAPEPLPATPPTERAPGRRGLGARRGPGAPSSYSAARASAALPSGGILRVMINDYSKYEVMKKEESLSNWNKETGRPVGQTRGKDNEEAQHVSM